MPIQKAFNQMLGIGAAAAGAINAQVQAGTKPVVAATDRAIEGLKESEKTLKATGGKPKTTAEDIQKQVEEERKVGGSIVGSLQLRRSEGAAVEKISKLQKANLRTAKMRSTRLEKAEIARRHSQEEMMAEIEKKQESERIRNLILQGGKK